MGRHKKVSCPKCEKEMRSDKLKNHNCPLNRKKEEIERRHEKRPVIEVPVLPGMEAIPRLMQILEHYFGKGNLEKTISLLSNGDLVHGIITSEAYPECIKVIQRYTNQEVDCTYDNGKTVNHKHFVGVLEGSRDNKTIKNVCGVKWGRIKNIEHLVNVVKYIQKNGKCKQYNAKRRKSKHHTLPESVEGDAFIRDKIAECLNELEFGLGDLYLYESYSSAYTKFMKAKNYHDFKKEKNPTLECALPSNSSLGCYYCDESLFEAKVERLFKIYTCNDQAAKKALIKLNYVPKKKVTKIYPPSILDIGLIEDEFDELM